MTAVGFCGGSHCGPEHGARLQEHRAALVMHDMRELATAMANSRQSQPDDTPNLRARPEPIDADVRRVPLEWVPGTPDRAKAPTATATIFGFRAGRQYTVDPQSGQK